MVARMAPVQVIREIDEGMRALDGESEIALDIETSGLSARRDKIAVLSLYGEKTNKAAILHLRGYFPDELAAWLSRPNVRFTAHYGVGFDMPFLKNNGVDTNKPKWFDTLVGETVVQTTGRRDVSASLRATLNRRLGIKVKKDANHEGWMNDELDDAQLEYALEDVLYLHETRKVHEDKCADNSQKDALALEMELVPVVADMTARGVPVDEERLNKYVGDRFIRSMELDETLGAKLGFVKLSSPVAVKRALAEIGINLSNTQKETLAIAAELAEEGSERAEILRGILEHRQALKAQMYDDEWQAQYIEKGRIYPRWWQCGTDTTRFSSSDPNAQQIPKLMRSVFGGNGYVIVKGDYSQLEVRIAADIAKDKTLLAILADEDGDIHYMVASQVFGIPIERVTKEQRQLSKAMSFTLIFGGGAKTLQAYAMTSGVQITRAYAQSLVNQFFARFVGLSFLKQRAIEAAERRKPKVLILPTGHRRVLAGSSLTHTRLLNTSVQGTAAAGIKLAMLEVARRGMAKYLILQVHDELVAEVPPAEARDYQAELHEAMLVGMREAVKHAPLAVNVESGEYWS